MKRELYYFDVYPRVVLEGKPVTIHIRPLSSHVCFQEGQKLTVKVYPLTEDIYSLSKPEISCCEALLEGGVLTFTHSFKGEQEHSVRIFEGDEEILALMTSVYSLKEDYFALSPYLGDFHVHSCMSDGVESPEFVAAMYRQAGFDFISITDHGWMEPSLRAIDKYKNVDLDFKLYPGEEVHSPSNHVHILNFGGDFSVNSLCLTDPAHPWGDPGLPEWNEAVNARAKEMTGLPEGVDPFVHASCLTVFDKIKEANGMSIFCHPFWIADVHNVTNEMTEFYLKNSFADAFELIGGQTVHENNMQIAFYQEMCSRGYQIPVVSNSDSHGTVDHVYFEQCKTIVLAKDNTREAIIEGVKNRNTAAISQYPNEEPRMFGSFRMVSYAMFLYENYFPLQKELCFEEGRLMRMYINGEEAAGNRLNTLKGQTQKLRNKFFSRV